MVFSTFATVLTKSIIRAATYLFFVLLGTAGMYFLMGYTFLGAVQVMVYAGGIVVLYVFAILLTRGAKDKLSDNTKQKIFVSALLSLVGFGTFVYAFLKAGFGTDKLVAPNESIISMKDIGMNLLSTETNGYLLPFEVVSLLLLACIVAALLIARKR
ncbi:NADH-quinone oxidoreductase subunit J [Alloprevotella tannerae]|uniref:NADH-quinone oxidoreductase subunit J family protein n=1 Tax=Alloprevotella tannerae TaxID=76122 RepID=UPI00391FB162